MKEFKIAENAAGQRLDRFLGKILPEADTAFLHRMLRKKNITRNDKKAEGSERLAAGDVIRVWLSDETYQKFSGTARREQRFPQWEGLQDAIVFENDCLLALNKPVGMLTQKAAPSDVSVNEYMLGYLAAKGEYVPERPGEFKPGVVNRLDRNTSGLVLAAKCLAVAQALSEQLREKQLRKFYLACVNGEVREAMRLSAFLYKDKTGNRVCIRETKKSAEDREIQTAFRPLAVRDNLSLLEVELLTGRSHQIRAQLAAIGHPIIGDPKYGNRAENSRFMQRYGLKHQLLHAYRLRFPTETAALATLSEKTISAAPPKLFSELFPEVN